MSQQDVTMDRSVFASITKEEKKNAAGSLHHVLLTTLVLLLSFCLLSESEFDWVVIILVTAIEFLLTMISVEEMGDKFNSAEAKF